VPGVPPSARRRSSVIRAIAIIAASLTLLIAAAPSRSSGYPTSAPEAWRAPGWWLSQAACIRSHEGWWTANTGNGYYGAYQFLASTWRSVGGPSLPHLVSPREQTYRAWLVWRRDGGSWREWGTAGRCGV